MSALPALAPLLATTAAPMDAGGEIAIRAGIDLVAVSLLTFVLFLPRHRRRDLVTVFWLFNTALFCVLLVINTGDIGVGAGLGLFAVLSIVRLRSEQYRNVEIGYFFVSLALALVNGLAPGLLLPLSLSAGLLVVVAVIDLPKLLPSSRHAEVVLDMVLEDHQELREELGRRLRALIVNVEVTQVDYVRLTMLLTVQYRPAAGTRRSDSVAA